MSKLNYKHKVAKVAAFLTAFSFALYGSLPVGTKLFDGRTSEIQTVSAASGSAIPGYAGGGGHYSYASSDGWGVNGAVFLKIFPADIDLASDIYNVDTAKERYKYEKYAIFVPVHLANKGSIATTCTVGGETIKPFDKLKVFTSMNSNGEYDYVNLDTNFIYYGNGSHSGDAQLFSSSGNEFDKFLENFSGLSSVDPVDNSEAFVSTAQSCLAAAANYLASKGQSDEIYNAYIKILKDKLSSQLDSDDKVKEFESLVNDLYNQPSVKFKSMNDRKFTLIVEPMLDICDDANKKCLASLYNYSNLLSINASNFTDTPESPDFRKDFLSSIFAGNLWHIRNNDNNEYPSGRNIVELPNNSNQNHPAYGATIMSRCLGVFVPAFSQTCIDNCTGLRDNYFNYFSKLHGGWTWFNIAGSDYEAPSTYNIVETATLDTSSGNDIFQNLAFDGDKSVQDAIYERAMTNTDILQNYYRRTTALTEEQWKSDKLVNVMSSIAGRVNVDENNYAFVDYNVAAEERKKNPENANFFLSISPIANFNSKFFGSNVLSYQKKDYILSNDSKVSTSEPSTLNPTGCLNYEPVLSYEEMTKGNNALYAAVQNKSNIVKGADFELSGIKVTATCYDTKTEQFDDVSYDISDGKTFVASNGTIEWIIPKEKVQSKFTDPGYINLTTSAFISEPDANGSTFALHKWFQQVSANENQKFANKHFTIEVRYLYNQGETPVECFEYTGPEAGGKFETEIPQYAINQPYSSILNTANLSVYDKKYTIAYDGKKYDMSGSGKAMNDALIQVPVIAECLVDPFYKGYLFKAFSPSTNPYVLETLVNSKNSQFIFEPKSSDDVDLYNSFRLNFERVPDVNKKFTHLNAFTYLKWASMENPVISQNISNALSLDSSFIASKNPVKDKIVVADWCDQSETAYNSGSRGVSNNRTVNGLYTIHADPLKLSGKEITVKAEINQGTLSCEGKTETENAERYLIMADSTYDTVCTIKNYAAKQNPNDTSFNYPTKPELNVNENSDDSYAHIYGVPESTISFIPEVPMVYYPDPESGPATLIVQSNQNREIKMVNYHEIDCDLNTSVSTSGMLPATDTRASSLRRSFGTPGENAPVLYGGSDVVNVVANNESKMTFRSYVLDVDSGSKAVVSQNGKSADSVASDWLKQYVHDSNKVTVSVTGKNSVYSSWGSDTPLSTYNLEPYDLTFEADTSDASYGVPTVYDLVVRDGRVTDILLNGSSVGKNSSIWTAVQNMKLNELFSNTLETTRSKNNSSDALTSDDVVAKLNFDLFYNSGTLNEYSDGFKSDFHNHWYGEGSSIFKLKVYETSFKSSDSTQLTNKIPLNAGPASVSSKNAFSSGYGVYVGFEASLKGANGTFKIAEDKKKAGSKISYIIPDQTVNDISH